jgi:cytochrome c peroxidase
MLKKVLITAIFFAGFSLSSFAQDFGYIGVDKCSMCHKSEKQGEQLKIWKASKHANAFKTLQSDKAKEIASKMGIADASKAKECLVCHASGYNVDAKLLDAKFSVEDGVQCETCHGPGSEYKSMKVMKSREESVKNGLKVWNNEEEIKKMCVTCHNEKSPTYKGFDFAKNYNEIKHNIPKN